MLHCAKKMKNDFEIVSVIDISKDKLGFAKSFLNLDDKALFDNFDDFIAMPKIADWLFVCTQDKQHLEHTIPAIKKGYNILLEKPIACSAEDCIAIEQCAKQYNVCVAVCHVLRYSKYYQKIKEIMDSGVLGKIIAIEQIENVGYWHQAHSFVRGDWKNSKQSTPMILAKCCHDLDIAVYLADSTCKQVSSQGSLNYFNKQNAPKGAGTYCLKDCKAKENCPYDCEKIYIDSIKRKSPKAYKYKWPQSRLVKDGVVTIDKVYDALNNTDFGKCVFDCDNDVVDYQEVNMLFDNGIHSNLIMTAFSDKIYRQTRIRGVFGELICDMNEKYMTLNIYGKNSKKIKLWLYGDAHGGGDYGLIKALAEDKIRTDISLSVQSHLIAFGAEQSRINNSMPVKIADYTK